MFIPAWLVGVVGTLLVEILIIIGVALFRRK